MLSQKNIDKLHMDGIYQLDPVLSWLPSYKRDNPYWCRNWTFKVHKRNNKYYMCDTYWCTGDEYPVELTDENFDKFNYLFNLDEVRKISSYSDWLEYPNEERWRVALDSGGIAYPKYLVKKNAKKVKDRVIERLTYEISLLEHELKQKKSCLNQVINDEIDLEYV